MRYFVLLSFVVFGCGTMFSGFKEYCEERVDCMDGNSDDEEACMLNIHNDRRIARVYGCEDDYMEYMECMKEDADCESYGRYDYWTADGDCEDDYEDYVDCMSDESSGSGWDDTGASFAVMEPEEEEENWSDSCSFFDGELCYEPNEPDNAAWCSAVGGEYAYDSCGYGYDGSCAVPAGGDFSDPATAYFYGDIDGVSFCESMGGTYTAN